MAIVVKQSILGVIQLFNLKGFKLHKKWWFICHVTRGRERTFRRDLAKRGILNFAPVQKTEKRMKPLLPGYVFVWGDAYKKFIFEKNIKGFRSVMMNGPTVYHLSHEIVLGLIDRQLSNEFDTSAKENIVTEFFVGERVWFVGNEKIPISKNEIGRIISMDKERATLLMGFGIWKIKFCFLRKMEEKEHPRKKAHRNRSASFPGQAT